ncbi:hypothetical protein AMTR_s00053p00163230 [Amborella trichopoda]|uniref:Uncharacterized protein n=1 Tax=Amborella trichopoda TaxID=13333 RepID=W1P5D1_AMBTC|nr:hypothetical protein AMTR_s00053p00163230 [Amborella trichopoda]
MFLAATLSGSKPRSALSRMSIRYTYRFEEKVRGCPSLKASRAYWSSDRSEGCTAQGPEKDTGSCRRPQPNELTNSSPDVKQKKKFRISLGNCSLLTVRLTLSSPRSRCSTTFKIHVLVASGGSAAYAVARVLPAQQAGQRLQPTASTNCLKLENLLFPGNTTRMVVFTSTLCLQHKASLIYAPRTSWILLSKGKCFMAIRKLSSFISKPLSTDCALRHLLENYPDEGACSLCKPNACLALSTIFTLKEAPLCRSLIVNL